MNVDPAVAALQAFQQAVQQGELGEWETAIQGAEEAFSTEVGPNATQAYERLQEFGERLPHAQAFQAFLIFITWQQVTEETIPKHFLKGRELCDRFLRQFRDSLAGSDRLQHVTALRESFQAGLGGKDTLMPEFDEDACQGGD